MTTDRDAPRLRRARGFILRVLDRVRPERVQVHAARGALQGARIKADRGSHRAYVEGTYEPQIVSTLIRLVKPGDVVADVGAHLGYFTLVLSRCVGPGGRVVAFEPHPANVAALRETVALNDASNVEVAPVAVWREDTRLSLGPSPYPNRGSSALPAVWMVGAAQGPAHDVECVTLDSFFQGTKPPALLKIDVEDSEAEVLEGARGVISQAHPTIVLETHRAAAEARCRDLLKALGYSFAPLGERHLLATWSPEGPRRSGANEARPPKGLGVTDAGERLV